MGLVSVILSHPFRLAGNGTIATIDQDTEQADAEQIAVLALTRIGERPLVPAFGISDPVFAGGIEVSELAAGLATYGPPVTIRNVTTRPVDEAGAELLVELEFD
jgi:hypothetical protein